MAHSYLKILIALDRMSFCCIHKQDDLATLICQTKHILWDEAPLTNKLTFESMDRTLRDLTDRNEPFGGIVFVMSKDFRQVLLIIPRGSHADIVSTSIKNSYLWEFVEVFRLSEICGSVMLLFTLILGITLLHTSFFVFATTSWKPSMRTTSSV
jgi:hypothetical protein